MVPRSGDYRLLPNVAVTIAFQNTVLTAAFHNTAVTTASTTVTVATVCFLCSCIGCGGSVALTGVAMDAFLSAAAPTFAPRELRPTPPWRREKTAAPAEEAPAAAIASSWEAPQAEEEGEAPQAEEKWEAPQAEEKWEAPPRAAAKIPKWDSWSEEEPSPDKACNSDGRDLDESPQRRYLPEWKRQQANLMQTQPKQRPKPADTEAFKREVRARQAEDRQAFRSALIAGQSEIADPRDLPWDVRGPPGPEDGGPQTWKGQKYRSGSGRWANAGGRNKDKYELYRAKLKEGLVGKQLHYWHPKATDGYWAEKAAEEEQASRSSQ